MTPNHPQPKAGIFLTRQLLVVLVFTLIYIAIAMFASLERNNTEFILYIGVMFVLLVAVGVLHFRIKLHTLTLWGLSLWGLAHMAGGLMPIPESWPRLGETNVLYNLWIIPSWLKFDQLVHAYGFGLVTWISWQGLSKAFLKNQIVVQPTFGLMVLCMATGMGFGALNEVIEFTASLLLPETNVGGYENTGWDLVFNFYGSSLAAITIFLWPRDEIDTPNEH